jgi:hydroxymethylpyrimidine pyrophosphatase-like HAD family hydrolase
MNIHVLASDYDGTIAEDGRVAPATAEALKRVRASSRRLVLVTGRMLGDLRSVCPEADRMFDAIVAENGALLYLPDRRETRALAGPPEPALVDALRRREVDFAVGTSIIATVERFAERALAAIRDAGVERTLVFNRGACMLLPGGVTKETGLRVALDALDLSPHNMVGVGDAENDHAFLSLCECAVAVADAVPALRDRADYVTRGPSGRGVVEFIEEHLLHDLVTLLPRITRHDLPLGECDGEPVTIGVHGTSLLVVGPSASGKSTLTGVLVERLVGSGRSVLLLDPEGDYQTLSELEQVVVLGAKAEQTLPSADEVGQLVRHPRTSLVLNLSALRREDKVDYATKILGVVAAARSAAGLPHWLIIDEAHHILPADGSPAAELLRHGSGSLCLITLTVEDLAPATHPLPNIVASTQRESLESSLRVVLAERGGGRLPELPGEPFAADEAALAWLTPEPRAARFRVATRRIHHRRHIRKYTEGELPPERSFFFRGPEGALNLRAANVARFVELASGVDEGTWAHHLRNGEYSAWIRQMIKDPELAADVERIEAEPLAPADSRRMVLEEIRRRYTV